LPVAFRIDDAGGPGHLTWPVQTADEGASVGFIPLQLLPRE